MTRLRPAGARCVRSLALLVVLGVVGCGGGDGGGGGSASVAGQVTKDDKPVPNVRVALTGPDTEPTSAQTDSQGRYKLEFDAVAETVYTIAVNQPCGWLNVLKMKGADEQVTLDIACP